MKALSIPRCMYKLFAEHASPHTAADLECCGWLVGDADERIVTYLIIPPQAVSTVRCVPTSEVGDAMATLISQGGLVCPSSGKPLVILGLVHTHPTQDCFLSSIDLHTLQGMSGDLAGSFVSAVVAPAVNKGGVFVLTKKGRSALDACARRLRNTGGFHAHADATSLYEDAMTTGAAVWNDADVLPVVDMRGSTFGDVPASATGDAAEELKHASWKHALGVKLQLAAGVFGGGASTSEASAGPAAAAGLSASAASASAASVPAASASASSMGSSSSAAGMASGVLAPVVSAAGHVSPVVKPSEKEALSWLLPGLSGLNRFYASILVPRSNGSSVTILRVPNPQLGPVLEDLGRAHYFVIPNAYGVPYATTWSAFNALVDEDNPATIAYEFPPPLVLPTQGGLVQSSRRWIRSETIESALVGIVRALAPDLAVRFLQSGEKITRSNVQALLYMMALRELDAYYYTPPAAPARSAGSVIVEALALARAADPTYPAFAPAYASAQASSSSAAAAAGVDASADGALQAWKLRSAAMKAFVAAASSASAAADSAAAGGAPALGARKAPLHGKR